MMSRILDLLSAPGRSPFMPCQELEFRAVDQDLFLRGLDAENVRDMARRHGIPVGLEKNESIRTAEAQSDFRGVIGACRKRLQGGLFLLEKQFERGTPGRVVNMPIGLFRKPPARHSSQIFQVGKLATAQEIPLDIFEGGFDFSLGLGPSS